MGNKTIDEILEDSEIIDVGESWFKVSRLPHNVFGIHEPHHWQEVISYLILGSEKAVLFDTGMGIKDISKVVRQLTDLNVIVVNSHAHFDHVGDNHRFETIYIYENELAIKWLTEGQANETLQQDTPVSAFNNGYPEGFNPEEYQILPNSREQIHFLHEGDVIDLGDRKLEVLHTPGHSNDSIMLLDNQNRILFTGDTFYPDWLFVFFDEDWGGSDLIVYAETMKRVVKLVPKVDLLYCSHNKALVDPKILKQVVKGFEAVINQEVEYELSELYGKKIRIHDFDGFSILTKAD
jgi:glyoxylase-like metal-dependent hydrolase (beta-lactamase superfamily II)